MKAGKKEDEIYKDENFLVWKKRWKERLKKNNNFFEKSVELMRKSNPLIIPRNHKVEEVLAAADEDNLKPLKKFLTILADPYTEQKNISEFQELSESRDKYQTFCGP